MASSQVKDELKALAKRSDEDIDYSDIPAEDPRLWKNAERARFYRPVKSQITMRLDADVLEWFKSHHAKYQTAVNQALREYMESHR